jgi:hypothetical protein
MIFVSLLWNIIMKGQHASTDAEAGAWLPFQKKLQKKERALYLQEHSSSLLVVEGLAGCLIGPEFDSFDTSFVFQK